MGKRSPAEFLEEARAEEQVRLHAADAIRELAAHVHAAEARLARMVAEFTADGMWNATGDWRSVAQWLGMNCGYAPGEAAALARVAEKVDLMPGVMEHAAAGEVSLGVAAMAARVASPELDATLSNIVRCGTPTQARRTIGEFRAARRREDDAAAEREAAAAAAAAAGGSTEDDAVPVPAPEPDDVVERSFWRSWFDDDGYWHGQGLAPAEVGALLDEAYAAALHTAEQSADSGDARPGAVDALRAFADMVLDTARERRVTRDGGDHFGVTVLIDLETLVSGTLRPGSICRLESGPHVTPGLVRRLAEEGFLQTLWHRGGIPLMLGTEARFASRAQRRALRFRDGGCAVPGCGATHHLHAYRVHAHHVVKYPEGPTDLDNLVLLCPFHHRRLHQGRLFIESDGHQRFTFRDAHGEELGNRLVSRRAGAPPVAQLELLPEHRDLGIDGDTPRPHGGYSPLTDYGLNVYIHTLLTAA